MKTMEYCAYIVVVLAYFLTPNYLYAQVVTVFIHADKEHTIRVNYLSDNSQVPCEVVYKKDTGIEVL